MPEMQILEQKLVDGLGYPFVAGTWQNDIAASSTIPAALVEFNETLNDRQLARLCLKIKNVLF